MPRRASIKAKVARRVGDVVVVITEVIGEEDTNRLPAVGDTVRPIGLCFFHFSLNNTNIFNKRLLYYLVVFFTNIYLYLCIHV